MVSAALRFNLGDRVWGHSNRGTRIFGGLGNVGFHSDTQGMFENQLRDYTFTSNECAGLTGYTNVNNSSSVSNENVKAHRKVNVPLHNKRT